jgi:protein-tyrosine-phosphatase
LTYPFGIASQEVCEMTVSLDPATQRRIRSRVDELCAEFGDRYGRPEIEALMDDSAQRLAARAHVVEYVPIMAFRLTRERLRALTRAAAASELPPGNWDVVYVSLSGGGRGQIAAVLTALLSDHRVAVHSAGTAVAGQIDPGVRTVIAELGVDTKEAFARPVTDEVLRGADVVVTMGHSVGIVDIPEHVRHEDWRVGDPTGAPIDEIRRVRTDIERRVRALLREFGVPSTPRMGN